MDNISFSSPQEAMWAGFIPFALCSFWGLRILLRGLRGDTRDSSGMESAPGSWFIIFGIFLQLPLAGYACFVWRQGLFGS